MAAFALLELGRTQDAAALYLHGALNHPRAACMLVGQKTTPPRTTIEEVTDHNTGVSLVQTLHGYLAYQRGTARRFFRDLLGTPRVASLLMELKAVLERRELQHASGERTAFDRMMHMRTHEFARQEASALTALLGRE